MSLSKYLTGYLKSDVADILCVILLMTFLSPACLVFAGPSTYSTYSVVPVYTRAVDKLQVFYPQLIMFLAPLSAKLLTDQIKYSQVEV